MKIERPGIPLSLGYFDVQRARVSLEVLVKHRAICAHDERLYCARVGGRKVGGCGQIVGPIGPVRSSRMPSYTEEQKRRTVETIEECGGSVTRAMRKGISHAPNAVPTAESARHVARKEIRRTLEPLRSGAEGAGRGVREVGHGRQGRRRDAGGIERRGGLQLGESRRRPEPSGGGQVTCVKISDTEARGIRRP